MGFGKEGGGFETDTWSTVLPDCLAFLTQPTCTICNACGAADPMMGAGHKKDSATVLGLDGDEGRHEGKHQDTTDCRELLARP